MRHLALRIHLSAKYNSNNNKRETNDALRCRKLLLPLRLVRRQPSVVAGSRLGRCRNLDAMQQRLGQVARYDRLLHADRALEEDVV
jgi:hypothetical protein